MSAASLAVCISIAAAQYGVSTSAIDAVIQSPARSAERVGVMGIPAQWMPYLQRYGFDVTAVRSDACTNVIAGTWILAYSQRMKQAVAAQINPKALPARAAPWQPLVQWVAKQSGVSPALINAVIEQESRYRPGIVSPAGAIGLMQIMPFNAQKWGIDPLDPAQNVWAGTWYLKNLLARYGGDLALALAAYNAGSGAVAKYGGIPPYRETQQYVPKVMSNYLRYADAVH